MKEKIREVTIIEEKRNHLLDFCAGLFLFMFGIVIFTGITLMISLLFDLYNKDLNNKISISILILLMGIYSGFLSMAIRWNDTEEIERKVKIKGRIK